MGTEMTGTRHHVLAGELIDPELVERLMALLKGHADIQAAYLFGSRARGTHGTGSDVDIAVVFAPGASAWSEVELQEQLAFQLGSPVQIVNLAHASRGIVEAVCRHGVPLVGDAELLDAHSLHQLCRTDNQMAAAYINQEPRRTGPVRLRLRRFCRTARRTGPAVCRGHGDWSPVPEAEGRCPATAGAPQSPRR